MKGWDRFIAQSRQDLKLWLFCMAVLSFFRAIFILFFRDRMDPAAPWTDIGKALANGLRYDSTVATSCVIITLLASMLCGFADLRVLADRVRSTVGAAFAVLATIISVITLTYFKEYNDHFNHFVFNLYYDDTKAILSTIWAGYRVIPSLIAIAVLSFLLVSMLLRVLKTGDRTRTPGRPLPIAVRAIAVLVLLAILVVLIRGSAGHRTVKLEDAAVTADAFLNKAVLNPFNALLYAYGTRQKLTYVMTGLEFYLPDRNVRAAAQAVFNDRRSLDDLDAYLLRTAPGGSAVKPRHIFLIVMESYDFWPMMDKYASLGLAPELSALGRRGISVENFMPASDGTATSLTALVSGLSDANVVTNYQLSAQTPYPSSIAVSFRKLGYRTRFFYGGYLSWQRIGDFMKGQGFEDIYGAAHIGSWASHNEWGVEDEALFDFVVKTVGNADQQPSFNIILTTSYHPPYELDVYRMGYGLREFPPDLNGAADPSVSLKMLGHLWYSDRCIGDFVRAAEKRFPAPLFAFTGDHFSRKFINSRPEPFEGSAVPFILYGPEVLRGVALPPTAAGSHIDIGPTLIELAAPRGHSYYAVGRSVLGPLHNRLGVSRDKMISSDFLFDVYAGKFHPLPGKPLPARLPDGRELKLLHDRLCGIAWWRIMRGASL